MLCKSWWTLACKSSNGVYTQELAVVLFGLTLIKIFTSLPILLKNVPPWTRAQVTALCVFTDEVARLWRLDTLVHVHTGGACNVSGVAQFAETTEGAHGVDALSIPTQVRHDFAFVNISAISSVAGAMGTELLVVAGSRQGADLTLIAPASASIAAAF